MQGLELPSLVRAPPPAADVPADAMPLVPLLALRTEQSLVLTQLARALMTEHL